MHSEFELEFFDAPQPFLDAAADVLASDPVLGSVIASVSQRAARELEDGRDSWAEVGAPFARWWLVVRDGSGAVVSAAMRTAFARTTGGYYHGELLVGLTREIAAAGGRLIVAQTIDLENDGTDDYAAPAYSVPVGWDEQRHLSASYQEAIGTVYLSLHPNPLTLAEALIHEFWAIWRREVIGRRAA